jgi:CelD/BcsL family acetyltransferase involved in cellulose biosynthesis
MQDTRPFDSDALAFQVLTEVSEITTLASEWDSLLDRSNCNRAFSSSKWFIATCRHNHSLQPYVVIVRRGAALAGILPLVLINKTRVATFPNYLTDYNDAIAAPDDTAAVTGLLNYARSAPNGYKHIVLSNIRQDSNCLLAMRMIEPRGWIDKSFREMVLCYYLRLPASHDDFLRTKDSRFRKRLKRLQGLADKSNLALRELEPDRFPPHKLPDAFLSLHLQRQRLKSCFEAASAQSFVEEVIPQLFQQRIIRACALVERDKIVAIDLYTMGRNSLCAWNGGFLSAAEHCSPGKLLINAGIKLAYALKVEEYDFMRGPEAYKTSWANNTRSIGQVELSVSAH